MLHIREPNGAKGFREKKRDEGFLKIFSNENMVSVLLK